MNIIISGNYPQSEKLISASRLFERKKLTQKNYEEALKEDILDFLSLQKEFKYSSCGLFNWQDLLRPLLEVLKNGKAETLVRFEETNTFWRLLEKKGPYQLIDNGFNEWQKCYFEGLGLLEKNKGKVISLAYPSLFLKYSKGWSSQEIEGFYIDFLKKLKITKEDCLVFLDIPEKHLEGASFFQEVKKVFDGQVFYRSIHASIAPHLQELKKWAIDGIGFDLSVEDYPAFFSQWPEEKAVLVGLLRTDNTLIQKKLELRAIIEEAYAFFPKSRVFFGNEGIAENVPRAVMDEKIMALMEALS